MTTRPNRSDSESRPDREGDTRRAGPVVGSSPGGAVRNGFLLGLRGGAVATVVMSAFRAPISESPPPTAWFWRTYVAGEGDPEDYPLAGLVLHVLYGVGAGVAFG